MTAETTSTTEIAVPTPGKFSDYLVLTKFRLAALVIFSAVLGYLIGTEEVDFIQLISLIIGGTFITGASNGLNQIAEKDIDKLMQRTKNRPLPTGRMQVNEALIICILLAISGTAILWFGTNHFAALLSVFSMFLYAFVYTPLKRISPISVFVGAIPGAFPPLLGWVAARGYSGFVSADGFEAILLFFIQFMWQFPHFWAIAWRSHEDYSKAGLKLLPLKNGLSKENAWIIFFYTVMILPSGWLPYIFGYCNLYSSIAISICALYFIYKGFLLLKTCSMKDATGLMFASFIYLPVVQLFLYFNF